MLPEFTEQLNLFNRTPDRIVRRDGLPEDMPVLPVQSAASSALLIADLLQRYEALVSGYVHVVEVNVYKRNEEALEFHGEVIDDAQAYAQELRSHWPGLRYRYRE